MQVKYEFEIHAKCPVDKKPDRYLAVAESNKILFCEDVVAEVEKLKNTETPQETLTENLSRALGCTVTTVGYHSGIKVSVRCD
jgi:hypothetical protein